MAHSLLAYLDSNYHEGDNIYHLDMSNTISMKIRKFTSRVTHRVG